MRGNIWSLLFCEKSIDANGKQQQSSEADEALPEEAELVVLVVVLLLVVGVRGMLMVGMVDGDAVMGGRAGDDKSKDTAEREGPPMENKTALMLPGSGQIHPTRHLGANLDIFQSSQTLTTCYMLMHETSHMLVFKKRKRKKHTMCQVKGISHFS